MRGRLALAIGALLSFRAGSAWPQECQGFSAPNPAIARFAFDAARFSYAGSLGGSVTFGRRPFASLHGGETYDSALDARTYDVAVEAGVPAARVSDVELCPVANVGMSFGPYDLLLTRSNYRYVDLGFGVRAGRVAMHLRGSPVLLYGAVRIQHLSVSTIPSDSDRANGVAPWSAGDWYGVIEFGLGVRLLKRVTVRPQVDVPFGFVPITHSPSDFAVPFGRENHELGLRLQAAVDIGRQEARPAIP